MLIVVAPGQGSQTPGMLTPWLELPAFAELIREAAAASGLNLVQLGTEADADTIRDTAVAQPLIVAAGLASAAAAAAAGCDLRHLADAVAGHSVGEFTASAMAGVLSTGEALKLVSIRGRAMAHAAGLTATGMAAVLGGDRDAVLAGLARHDVIAANENGANQIVAAGTLAQLEALAADPPAGTKVRPLQVAGAFHTQYMQSAQSAVREAVVGVAPAVAATPIISNQDAAALTDGEEITKRLVTQITSPVRWDLCMEKFRELGVTGIVELFPGGTLTGIAKRALPGVDLFPIKSPEDLAGLREFAIAHHGRVPDSPAV